MHYPAECDGNQGAGNRKDSHTNHLACRVLIFGLGVDVLIGQIADHHRDTDCLNDVECRQSEGGDEKPSPEDAQRPTIQHCSDDHPNDEADNSKKDHFVSPRLLRGVELITYIIHILVIKSS